MLPSAPVTLEELKAILAGDMFEDWQKDTGCTDDVLREYLRAIPSDWARDFARTFRSMPVSRWPKVIHAPKLSHKRLRRASVESNMDAEHRLAISKGQGTRDAAFRKAIRARGYTQNALAEAVGINQAVLSLHRRDLRKIPLARAKRIEALTGWPANAKHWPCGIVTDGE